MNFLYLILSLILASFMEYPKHLITLLTHFKVLLIIHQSMHPILLNIMDLLLKFGRCSSTWPAVSEIENLIWPFLLQRKFRICVFNSYINFRGFLKCDDKSKLTRCRTILWRFQKRTACIDKCGQRYNALKRSWKTEKQANWLCTASRCNN